MSPPQLLRLVRLLTVSNVALAAAVLVAAPRALQVAMATVTCGITVWGIAHQLAGAALARPSRDPERRGRAGVTELRQRDRQLLRWPDVQSRPRTGDLEISKATHRRGARCELGD
jgi:hypothetical protein